MDITKEQANKLDESEIEDLQDWIDVGGKKQLYGPRLLMLDMVKRDLIPEGDYLINIFW
jgi:hypothetical protein